MKKLISLFLALAMCLPLAACREASSPTPAPTQSPAPAPEGSSAPVETAAMPEGYPAQTIDWLVPVAAGAAVDLHVRALDQAVDLGANTSITNMPGANQTLGLTEAYNRDGDGYTITSSAFAGLVIQPNTIETEYKLEDFRHIAALNEPAENVIVAQPGSAVDTWDGLKAKLESSETVYFTAANAGAVAHMAFLSLLEQLGGGNTEFVAFDGTAAAATAVMGGHVDIAILDIGIAANYVKDNTLVNVLTLSDERSDILPDDLCAGEVGITGMDNFAGFLWVAVKADTPDAVVEYMKEKIYEALASQAYQEFLATQNETMTTIYTEEQITARLEEASRMYAHIISEYLA